MIITHYDFMWNRIHNRNIFMFFFCSFQKSYRLFDAHGALTYIELTINANTIVFTCACESYRLGCRLSVAGRLKTKTTTTYVIELKSKSRRLMEYIRMIWIVHSVSDDGVYVVKKAAISRKFNFSLYMRDRFVVIIFVLILSLVILKGECMRMYEHVRNTIWKLITFLFFLIKSNANTDILFYTSSQVQIQT